MLIHIYLRGSQNISRVSAVLHAGNIAPRNAGIMSRVMLCIQSLLGDKMGSIVGIHLTNHSHASIIVALFSDGHLKVEAVDNGGVMVRLLCLAAAALNLLVAFRGLCELLSRAPHLVGHLCQGDSFQYPAAIVQMTGSLKSRAMP